MKNITIIAVVFLASCADGRRAPPASEGTKASAQAVAPAEPAPAPAPATSVAPVPSARLEATAPAAQSAEGAPGAPLVGRVGAGNALTVPPVQSGTLARDQSPAVPATLGGVAFASAGCATAATEEEGAKFAARATTRSGAPVVAVTAVHGGATVKHEVTHACCLKASVVSRIEERVAVITEKLTGVPCRCICGSTLTSLVALSPGAWKIAVDVDTNGSIQRIGTYDVDVN